MSGQNIRPEPDRLLSDIAGYVLAGETGSREAFDTARLCLMDALGCAAAALNFPACTKLLGPLVPGAEMPGGARVPGTGLALDPVKAAFDLGAMIRWLDYNDTWLAAEWGHPSDNLGAILMTADWLAHRPGAEPGSPITMRGVLSAMVQAYEIQGVLALDNAFNRVGLDHVLLVKVASTAVVTRMMGGSREEIINAVSNAWVDGQALRTYRHAPNTGSRKSWAAGDAASRAVRLALMARAGEMGYHSALSAETWGFEDALFRGQKVVQARPFGSYVMENILFKVLYPAEFHAQTAVEAAVQLHSQVAGRLEAVERVVITTQESAMRIIDKSGPLYNPADRDHCIQYMTAVGLIRGGLTAADYEDEAAADPRIDALRERTVCVEDPRYSRDYLDPHKRSIANAVQVFFTGGSSTPKVEVEYPLGHRRRRAEATPLLFDKFRENLAPRYPAGQIERITSIFKDAERLDEMPVDRFVGMFVFQNAVNPK